MKSSDTKPKKSNFSTDEIKVPPHDINAEAAVLSAMIIDDWAVSRVQEIIKEEHFYKRAHQQIFNAILKLFNSNVEIDLVTLIDQLKKDGKFDDVGGTAYLSDISDFVSSSANVESYAQIVLEKAILRYLIKTSNGIIQNCYNPEEPSKVIVQKAEKEIFEVTQNLMREGFESASKLVPNAVANIEKKASLKSKVVGIATGFPSLDAKTGGLSSGQFVVVAGRPSMGKTSLAVNIGFQAAVHQNKKVGIFSLEMDKETLIMRMLSSGAEVSLSEMLHGYGIDSQKIFLINTVADKLIEAPIFIDDIGSNNMNDIRSKSRRLKAEEGLDLLIIDYIQLMKPVSERQSRNREITEISREIKILAKELEIPIIAVSQLSRAPETRSKDDRMPRLADLRESGAIEQDADLVFLLYREDYYEKVDPEEQGIAQIDVAKNRNGPQGRVKVRFLGEYTMFKPLDSSDEM